MNRPRFLLALAGMLLLTMPSAAAKDDAESRADRWSDLRQSLFGDRRVGDGAGKIALEAPERALDAALVPVTITVANTGDVRSVYLVIDDNPAPVAAHVVFGPRGDPGGLKFRVRVDRYTNMRAIEETRDGALFESVRFVKAAGGCSAPAGDYDETKLAEIGRMKLRPAGEPASGEGWEAQLLIRHPNFNGMQMDQITRTYTPARFLKRIDIAIDGENVLHLESDISLATDPAITFRVAGPRKGKLAVEAGDSAGGDFKQVFDLDRQGS